MNSNQAREAFKKKLGVRAKKGWEKLTDSDIYMLASHIAKELETHESDHPSADYRVGKVNIIKSTEGIIRLADIRVNQTIKGNRGWEERQAITFDVDGFIGFCGWASISNSKPFIKGFMNWLEAINEQGND